MELELRTVHFDFPHNLFSFSCELFVFKQELAILKNKNILKLEPE